MKYWLVGTCLLFVSNAQGASNSLLENSSPYLALHGNDPIDWQEWKPATLEKAKREKKLLFVSIGYFACHWCHVMQRESFSDLGIAKIVNEEFIAVKVDRELNPVLDSRLIDFVQATTGRAGWPLNVFLTPEAWPLVGATYLPPENFKSAIKQLSSTWQGNKVMLRGESQKLVEALIERHSKNDKPGSKASVSANFDTFFQQVKNRADTLQGGFGDQNKFPSIVKLRSIMRSNQKYADADLNEFIQLTLEQMQSQGLMDQVGGGFFRYTVDPDWQTPHFEKMLYTNAMMVPLYLEAAKQYTRPDFQHTALKTLAFLRESMKGKQGAFISSLSAVDDKGVEGAYYQINYEQLQDNLTEKEAGLISVAWGLAREEIIGQDFLPIHRVSTADLADQLKIDVATLSKEIDTIKHKLLRFRKTTRSLPVDNKQLTGWNALTLSAFAAAYDIEPSTREDGTKLAEWLQQRWVADRLLKTDVQENESGLHDYAATALALMEWGIAADDDNSLRLAEKLVVVAIDKFHSKQGWLDSDSSLLPYEQISQHSFELSLPSSEVMLLEAISLSPELKATVKLKAFVETIATQSTVGLESNPLSFASLVSFFYLASTE